MPVWTYDGQCYLKINDKQVLNTQLVHLQL